MIFNYPLTTKICVNSFSERKSFTDVPGRPGKPEAIEVDQEHIKLMWTMPMSNGGSPIVGYDVERRERSTTGRWAKITRSPIKVKI